MDDKEEQGMDTTYVGIMLVVFLVIAALAIDIGYLYVSEDDLQNAAETSALAGAQAMKQRIHGPVEERSGKAEGRFQRSGAGFCAGALQSIRFQGSIRRQL